MANAPGRTLQGCSAFVLLIGRDGVQRWVGAEVQVALIRYFSPHDDALRLPIFPILLDEAKQNRYPLSRTYSSDGLADRRLTQNHLCWLRFIRIDDALFEGCPFLGLSTFGIKDAKLFFGRRQETLEALACWAISNEPIRNS